MHDTDDGTAWYAVRTRSRHEKVVHRLLGARGVESFLPMVRRRNRWADRWKVVDLPLFPGYCFARFAWTDRLPVLTTAGAVEILGLDGVACPIPDDEIAAVRQLVTSVLPVDPHPYLREGMRVEVVRGPLAGLEGVLVRKGRQARLVVSVRLIQQAASIELDADDVVAVRPGAAVERGK